MSFVNLFPCSPSSVHMSRTINCNFERKVKAIFGIFGTYFLSQLTLIPLVALRSKLGEESADLAIITIVVLGLAFIVIGMSVVVCCSCLHRRDKNFSSQNRTQQIPLMRNINPLILGPPRQLIVRGRRESFDSGISEGSMRFCMSSSQDSGIDVSMV